ncbi:MAG: BspA family leucine-rich repeat surface protein, partial [Muribaculaceae bacterium]|nr:BspA family leucine-rich repeat surface protein [Muribaculaceae bacterium]
TSLVGGQGTTWNESNPTDKTYAHIDGGTSNPGYFTDKNAPTAYACYTSSNTTLTFYYDNQRSSRSGTTYDLNTGTNFTDWHNDGTCQDVTQVVFDPSFANARPTSTSDWFDSMTNLESITGMNYLNTSEVTSMAWMFLGCRKLTSLDVSHFNTSKVIYMTQMFYRCIGLTSLDLSSFNTSKVIDMQSMFEESNKLRTIYVGSGWSTTAVASSTNMFYNCTSLVGGKGTTYDASNIDAAYAHIDGGPSNPGYFTRGTEAYACYTSSNTTLTFYYDNQRSSRTGTTYDLNTGSNDPGWRTGGINANVTKVVFDPSFADARPTTTYNWFYYMANLQSITGMSNLNTSEVTNMAFMFYGCNQLTSIDLSHFNTSQVTDMSVMFYGCIGLTSLDLGSFNTSQVTNMTHMFRHSNNLRTIYVGDGWSTAAVTNSATMFYNCTSLVGGQGTTYDANHVDKTYAHIDGGTSNPGYFTAKNASQRGDINGDGLVNVADVTALIQIVLNSTPVDLSVADLSG